MYWYQFVATPIYSANMGGPSLLRFMGSFHGAEVPFVFGDQFEVGAVQCLVIPQIHQLNRIPG